jgi:hypothetical protein
VIGKNSICGDGVEFNILYVWQASRMLLSGFRLSRTPSIMGAYRYFILITSGKMSEKTGYRSEICGPKETRR